MYLKKIPGYCSLVDEGLKLFGIENLQYFDKVSDERELLKGMMIKVQHNRLIEEMLKLSKTDGLLKNFSYDGQMKGYLLQLPFHESKEIFLIRSRMFPTKANFPGRWLPSNQCPFCCEMETDEHLFQCCGYMDLHQNKIDYNIFMNLDCEMDVLKFAAKTLVKIHSRLAQINDDG